MDSIPKYRDPRSSSVDAGRQPGSRVTGRVWLVEHQELAALHQIPDFGRIRSIAALEEGFDLKRRIDERGDRRRFIGARYAKLWQDHPPDITPHLAAPPDQIIGSALPGRWAIIEVASARRSRHGRWSRRAGSG